jgi:hypothetical protein
MVGIIVGIFLFEKLCEYDWKKSWFSLTSFWHPQPPKCGERTLVNQKISKISVTHPSVYHKDTWRPVSRARAFVSLSSQ